MSIQFNDLARTVAADGRVSAEELRSLRQLGWGDGQIHREEAEALFAINRAISGQDAGWTDFFVEAVAEYVLNGTEPRHMCTEDEAAWLIAQIEHDGRVESVAELETLVRIVERAQNVPDSLKHYALTTIEAAVLTGTGPTRCGGELSDTHISAAECKLVRRTIFASGGHGPAAVSRFDAEMLFRLKDATLGADNAPEWKPLFVDGVANYLKGFTLKHAQLSHERQKELESFIVDNRANVGRFFGAMAREIPQTRNHFGKVFGKKAPGPDYTMDEVEGNLVTESERNWLDAMVGANGQVDEYDRALLDRIAAED